MPALRLALNQIDTTFGDLPGNADLVVRWTRHAADQGAQLVAFPDATLIGSPAEAQQPRPWLLDASRSALVQLAERLESEGLGGTPVVLGCVEGRGDGPASRPALLHQGHVLTRPATHGPVVVRLHGVDVALGVGGDLQQDGKWLQALSGAGLLLVTGAFPYATGGGDARLERVRDRARAAGCAVACVNLTGGQDERVFDGDSLVVDAKGEVLARAPQFEEGCLLADLDLPPATSGPDGPGDHHVVISEEAAPAPAEPVAAGRARRMDELEEVYAALVCGVRAQTAKNGFTSILVGLDGGIGSALVAAVAVDAIGAEDVHGVTLPTSETSGQALENAAETARRTGLVLRSVPLDPVLDACTDALDLTDLADLNLQARLCGTVLAALAETEGRLLLATSDRTGLTIGHPSVHGQAMGAFAPLRHVYRTTALRLAKWRNAAAAARGEVPPVPERTLTDADDQPGAEPLPPYEVLDALLTAYVDEGAGESELVGRGFPPETVARVTRLADAAASTRHRHPPGTRL